MATLLGDKLKGKLKLRMKELVLKFMRCNRSLALHSRLQKIDSRCLRLGRQVEWLTKTADENKIIIRQVKGHGVVVMSSPVVLMVHGSNPDEAFNWES